MNFDPKLKVLCSRKEVDEYLARDGVRLPSNVKVEWCPSDTDYTEALEAGGVYLYPQVLALGLKFHLTDFIRDFLRRYRMVPSQLVVGVGALSWASRTPVTGSFLMLVGSRTSPPSTWLEEPRRADTKSGSENLIVNLANSDHDWHDTVIQIYGAWETVMQKDHGAVPTVWNKGTHMHREIPVTEEIEGPEPVSNWSRLPKLELVAGSKPSFHSPYCLGDSRRGRFCSRSQDGRGEGWRWGECCLAP